MVVVLHLSYKLGYLEKVGWTDEWREDAVKIIKEEFICTYAKLDIESTLRTSQSSHVCNHI